VNPSRGASIIRSALQRLGSRKSDDEVAAVVKYSRFFIFFFAPFDSRNIADVSADPRRSADSDEIVDDKRREQYRDKRKPASVTDVTGVLRASRFSISPARSKFQV